MNTLRSRPKHLFCKNSTKVPYMAVVCHQKPIKKCKGHRTCAKTRSLNKYIYLGRGTCAVK